MAKKKFNQNLIVNASKHLSEDKVNNLNDSKIATEEESNKKIKEESNTSESSIELKGEKDKSSLVPQKTKKVTQADDKKPEKVLEMQYLQGSKVPTLKSLVDNFTQNDKACPSYSTIPLSDNVKKKVDLICSHYKITKAFYNYLLEYTLDHYTDEILEIFEKENDFLKK